jgi:hypothetical protein
MVSVPEVDRQGTPTGRRMRQEKWLLLVELDPEFVAQQFAMQQRQALSAIMALPAPEDGDGDEAHEADEASARSVLVTPPPAEVDYPAGNGVGTVPDDLEAHAQEQASNGNRVLVEHLKRCRQAEQEVGLEPTPLPAGLKEVAIRDMNAALLQQTIDGILQRLRGASADAWEQEAQHARDVGGDAPALVEACQLRESQQDTGHDPEALAAMTLAARARVAARTATLPQDPVQVVGTLHQDRADSQREEIPF